MRPVTFPSLEAFGSVVAGTVAIKVHHVEDVTLGLIFWDRVLVVRAENIQVVIDADVNVVVTPLESRVAAVPVDGVAVGDGLGARVLAEHTHPEHQKQKRQHLHVQHHAWPAAEHWTRHSGERAGIRREKEGRRENESERPGSQINRNK